jgi:hypothetical protein
MPPKSGAVNGTITGKLLIQQYYSHHCFFCYLFGSSFISTLFFSPCPCPCLFIHRIAIVSFVPYNGRIDFPFLLPLMDDFCFSSFASSSQSSMPLPLPRSAVPLARGPYLFVPFTIIRIFSIQFSFHTMMRLTLLEFFFSNLYRIPSCLPPASSKALLASLPPSFDSINLTLLFQYHSTVLLYLRCIC